MRGIANLISAALLLNSFTLFPKQVRNSSLFSIFLFLAFEHQSLKTLVLCICLLNVPHRRLFRFNFLWSEVTLSFHLCEAETLQDQVNDLSYWKHERKFPQIREFRPVRDLNPRPLPNRCSALQTELTSQLGAWSLFWIQINLPSGE